MRTTQGVVACSEERFSGLSTGVPVSDALALFGQRRLEFIGDANQFNERVRLHLMHDVPSMDLYCGFAGSDFPSNLFVRYAGHHQFHNGSLSRCQGKVSSMQFADFTL